MLVIAHRGAMLKAPENSLEAFSIAVAEGARRIELDLRLSQDHQIFVCHDDHTARITSEPMFISQSSSQELLKLRLANGEPLGQLSAVLAWWQPHHPHVSLNLELKSTAVAMTTALARQLTELTPTQSSALVLSSRSLQALRRCQEHPSLASIPRAFIWERSHQDGPADASSLWGELHEELTAHQIRILHPQATAWHQDLQWRARADNYLVYTWSSASENELLADAAIWHKLLKWQVDGHCTNMPLEFNQFLRQNAMQGALAPKICAGGLNRNHESR